MRIPGVVGATPIRVLERSWHNTGPRLLFYKEKRRLSHVRTEQ